MTIYPSSGGSFFTLEEFSCKCGCGQAKMDDSFVYILNIIRKAYNKPMIISSGYRCPHHNASVSQTGSDGPHTTGRAADIVIAGAEALRLVKLGFEFGISGFGINQKGPLNKRYIHLDTIKSANRPMIWSY